jgi:hypothetical protein
LRNAAVVGASVVASDCYKIRKSRLNVGLRRIAGWETIKRKRLIRPFYFRSSLPVYLLKDFIIVLPSGNAAEIIRFGASGEFFE